MLRSRLRCCRKLHCFAPPHCRPASHLAGAREELADALEDGVGQGLGRKGDDQPLVCKRGAGGAGQGRQGSSKGGKSKPLAAEQACMACTPGGQPGLPSPRPPCSAHPPGPPGAAPCPPSCRWGNGSSRPGSTRCGTARCSSPGPASQTWGPPAGQTGGTGQTFTCMHVGIQEAFALRAMRTGPLVADLVELRAQGSMPCRCGARLGGRGARGDRRVVSPRRLAGHGAADVAGAHLRALHQDEAASGGQQAA